MPILKSPSLCPRTSFAGLWVSSRILLSILGYPVPSLLFVLSVPIFVSLSADLVLPCGIGVPLLVNSSLSSIDLSLLSVVCFRVDVLIKYPQISFCIKMLCSTYVVTCGSILSTFECIPSILLFLNDLVHSVAVINIQGCRRCTL